MLLHIIRTSLVIYLDDILFIGKTEVKILRSRDTLIFVVQNLRLVINQKELILEASHYVSRSNYRHNTYGSVIKGEGVVKSSIAETGFILYTSSAFLIMIKLVRFLRSTEKYYLLEPNASICRNYKYQL